MRREIEGTRETRGTRGTRGRNYQLPIPYTLLSFFTRPPALRTLREGFANRMTSMIF
ncbi:hypothetical protein [Chroococcidiopsis sp. CCNUC1]|uniref:hypothetical protein n=1 Tax=Chroococcidiopsis sp. CCNUC1 TaxID=2653189 RepID=UPI00202210AF|nr:hypothetical protein [Chroococcidiopsis sp. CCNUC1]URD47776.1 hypothetical protein M5J74_15675 [Chroococcidiopsis sp. CCNUC1]